MGLRFRVLARKRSKMSLHNKAGGLEESRMSLKSLEFRVSELGPLHRRVLFQCGIGYSENKKQRCERILPLPRRYQRV